MFHRNHQQYGITFAELISLAEYIKEQKIAKDSEGVLVYEWLQEYGFDVKHDNFAWKFEPAQPRKGDEPEDSEAGPTDVQLRAYNG